MPSPGEGNEVSAVATTTDDASGVMSNDNAAALRDWIRTTDQIETVAEYQAMIDDMYAGADPALLAELKNTSIFGTDELMRLFGYKRKTRVFQLYTEARDLAEAGQTPHPSAIPDADASDGHRGARPIRGVMSGRVVQWALQSGRFYWHSIDKRLAEQTAINHGGAPRRV